VISVCLPTLRPLLLVVSSKFSSKEGHSKPTVRGAADLFTVGGGGGQKQRAFQRINESLVLRPNYGDQVTSQIGRASLDRSRPTDDVPLNAITVRTDVEWSERSSK
jgi:hypothetical protein